MILLFAILNRRLPVRTLFKYIKYSGPKFLWTTDDLNVTERSILFYNEPRNYLALDIFLIAFFG